MQTGRQMAGPNSKVQGACAYGSIWAMQIDMYDDMQQ